MVHFVNPTWWRKINGKVDKLNIDNGFQLIFRLYFRKTSLEWHGFSPLSNSSLLMKSDKLDVGCNLFLSTEAKALFIPRTNYSPSLLPFVTITVIYISIHHSPSFQAFLLFPPFFFSVSPFYDPSNILFYFIYSILFLIMYFLRWWTLEKPSHSKEVYLKKRRNINWNPLSVFSSSTYPLIFLHTHTHTHTHIYIYIYIYISSSL